MDRPDQIQQNLDYLHFNIPNDLWIDDRKAGGLLIENKYRGISWNWSVVGIGINVNQLHFSDNAKKVYMDSFEFNKVYDEFALYLENLI